MKIHMEGGSKAERTYDYPKPLPAQIIFDNVDTGTREVYYRKPSTATYLIADDVPDFTVRTTLGIPD